MQNKPELLNLTAILDQKIPGTRSRERYKSEIY